MFSARGQELKTTLRFDGRILEGEIFETAANAGWLVASGAKVAKTARGMHFDAIFLAAAHEEKEVVVPLPVGAGPRIGLSTGGSHPHRGRPHNRTYARGVMSRSVGPRLA